MHERFIEIFTYFESAFVFVILFAFSASIQIHDPYLFIMEIFLPNESQIEKEFFDGICVSAQYAHQIE